AGRLGPGPALRRRRRGAPAVRGDADPGTDRFATGHGPAEGHRCPDRRCRRARARRAAGGRVPLELRAAAPVRLGRERRSRRLPHLGAAVRGAVDAAARGSGRRDRGVPPGSGDRIVHPIIPYLVAAVLFGLGIYGVLVRRNAVLVLAAVELVLVTADNTVTTTLPHSGSVFALFVIVLAAAEIGVGLAIVLQLYRLRGSISADAVPLGERIPEDDVAPTDTPMSAS